MDHPTQDGAVLPIWIGQEASQHFDIEIALAFEVAIKSAAGEARVGHDGIHRDVFKPMSIEEPPGALDNPAANLFAVTRRVRHAVNLLKYYIDHIFCYSGIKFIL